MGPMGEDRRLGEQIDTEMRETYNDASGQLEPMDSKAARQSKNLGPTHVVQIPQPFYLGVREVTRGHFRVFIRDTGYKTEAELEQLAGRPAETWEKPAFLGEFGIQPETHPVVNVTHNDALKFCEWLSRRERVVCRLPTEAEWEYACRAGTTTLWSHGNDLPTLKECANVADGMLLEKAPANGRITQVSGWPGFYFPDGYLFTAHAGIFRPNAFGLYDMHGNVREWCSDPYTPETNGKSPETDARKASAGNHRVLRGGSWKTLPQETFSATRSGALASYRAGDVGFRIVRELPPARNLNSK